jgi:hypothetical protein
VADPKLIEAVLSEEWAGHGFFLVVTSDDQNEMHAATFDRDDGDVERARQAALGKKLLQYIAANHYEDCVAHGPCPLCAIVEELRGGK